MSAAALRTTTRAVAALFLARQWLDRPRERRLTATSLQDFVAQTCGLQIDSVQVVERTHHLVLWSRFGEYDRAAFDRLVYERRVLFEYLTHVACFVATRDLPLVRHWMESTPERWNARTPGWARKQAALIDSVETAIRTRGPLGNAEFERSPDVASDGWGSGKPAARVLDYLWKCGRIAVRSRTHFQKRYDLAERVLPQLAAPSGRTREQALRERLLRSFAAMGAATLADLTHYWTWPRIPVPEIRQSLAALVHAGEVRELTVEGLRAPWFIRADDVPALERAARVRRPSSGTTLLSPFDSFLWHRARTHDLFGFFYRIEIYVPSAKRQHGYYSLPLLHDGHLIGRIDTKAHRETGVLEVRHAHFEDGFAAGKTPSAVAWGALEIDAALAGTARALWSLARFVGATRVELRKTSPARLRAPLTRALRDAS